MKKIWVTADLHFGHASIIGYCSRPFATTDEMDEALVEAWNSRVDWDDEVYVLGDFSKDEAHGHKVVARLAGIKTLVAGNHDACFWGRDDFIEARARYLQAGWHRVERQLRMGNVLLHHYPFAGSRAFPDRDPLEAVRMPPDDGSWLLHGHVHELWKKRGRMINVGVDMWNYSPVAWNEIVELMNRGEN